MPNTQTKEAASVSINIRAKASSAISSTKPQIV